jgi:hypothetical protein
MDTFLGRSTAFWTAVEAIAVCLNTAVLAFSLWFLYRQLRAAAKSFEFNSNRRLQELVDDFREQRHILFNTVPLEIALTQDQFSKRPPGRHRLHRPTKGELHRMRLTSEQEATLRSIGHEQRECAKRIIARLNDIGQLVEDGFIDRRIFLGKYHVMAIQCCHMVEAIRRDEELRRGGNYGQRLLRMRHWASIYNDVWPKHRAVPIDVSCRQEGAALHRSGSPLILRRVIYRSPPPTIRHLLIWAARRLLSWY